MMTDDFDPPSADGSTDPSADDAQESSGADSGAPREESPLQSALAERDRNLELARRIQAEFENYQKRVRRDMESERRYAALPVLNDLLPVLDNLERALQSAPSEESVQGFVEGVRLLRKQWLDVLDKHGVRKIATDGESFDVNVHEAIMQQPSADHPPMTVLHTVRTGYQMHDRILRPAQVIVSASAATS
jgi:molecular chaperone GrpE